MEQLFNQSGAHNGSESKNERPREASTINSDDPFRNDPYAGVIITVNEMRMWASGKLIRPRSLL